jgi:predicted nucleic acid-binding protein
METAQARAVQVNKFLLDTNVVSELRKRKPHGAVVAWLSQLQTDQIFVSAVTLGELQIGIERTRDHDLNKAQEIELWVNSLLDSLAVLSMDAACFREWARLMHRRPAYLLEDAMIAATARIHQLVVSTRNERDFQGLGVQVFNPFQYPLNP